MAMATDLGDDKKIEALITVHVQLSICMTSECSVTLFRNENNLNVPSDQCATTLTMVRFVEDMFEWQKKVRPYLLEK